MIFNQSLVFYANTHYVPTLFPRLFHAVMLTWYIPTQCVVRTVRSILTCVLIVAYHSYCRNKIFFPLQILGFFFKIKHFIGHISGIVGPIDGKPNGIALVGYWVNYLTLEFDLIHDPDLGFFMVKFRNSCFAGIYALISVKRKTS